jgi:hypoxanthine phosphoribosyltransferase
MPSQLVLSWQEFDQVVAGMAQYLDTRRVQRPVIVAEPRGGLALALALSHAVPGSLLVVGAESIKAPPEQLPPVVWVDDIVDSGITLRRAREVLPLRATCLAWCTKVDAGALLQAFHRRVSADRWVVFPWERRDARSVARDQAAYRQARGLR